MTSLLVEKGLSSTRAGTKAKSLEGLMLFIEVDVADPVVVSGKIENLMIQ